MDNQRRGRTYGRHPGSEAFPAQFSQDESDYEDSSESSNEQESGGSQRRSPSLGSEGSNIHVADRRQQPDNISEVGRNVVDLQYGVDLFAVEEPAAETVTVAGTETAGGAEDALKMFTAEYVADLLSNDFTPWRRRDVGVDQPPLCTELRQRYRDLRPDLIVDHFLHDHLGYGMFACAETHDISGLRAAIDNVMFFTPVPILEAVLDGNLPRRAVTPANQDLRNALAKNSAWAMEGKHKPVIYGNYLVNADSGCGPTYQELSYIVADYERYVTIDRFAREVDSAINGKPALGVDHRRYLSNHVGKRVPSRNAALQSLIDALRRRITADLDAGSTPTDSVSPPLAEIGFTTNAVKRRNNHRQHKSSNFLMNLTESLLKLRYPGRYRMEFYILLCIPYTPLCSLAEAFFTVICQGYALHGGGFGYHAPGLSTDGANKITAADAQSQFEWIHENIDWLGGMRHHFAPLRAVIREDREENMAARMRGRDFSTYVEGMEALCAKVDEYNQPCQEIEAAIGMYDTRIEVMNGFFARFEELERKKSERMSG